jgi:hypothetical protein
MNDLFSPIGNHADESPCTWFEDAGLLLGAALPFICIGLGLFGPDIASLFFN